MQKNLLFTLLYLCYSLNGSAQTYKIEVDFQPYSELTEDTLVFQEAWFNSIKKVPLGFTFEFFDTAFDSVTIWNDALAFDYERTTEDSVFFLMQACDAFLSDRSIPGTWQTPQSPITYKIEGVPGNRIFKYQVKNAGFSEGTADDYANFQVWLYEYDQSIEFRYGDIYAPSEAWQEILTAPLVSLLESFEGEIIVVEGDEDAAYLTLVDPNAPFIVGLSAPPVEGRVFRFKRTDVNVTTLGDQPNISLQPNPINSTALLDIPDHYLGMPYYIINTNGTVRQQGILASKTLNVNDLTAGTYLLKIGVSDALKSIKFIKK